MFKKQTYALLLLLFFMEGCSYKASFFDALISYELPPHPTIDLVLQTIHPKINAIIDQELSEIFSGKELQTIRALIGFYPKDAFRLTMAYANQFQKKEEGVLESIIQEVTHEQNQGVAYLSTQVDFFGPHQNAFVIKVDDPHKYLQSINQSICNKLHILNEIHKKKNNNDLYNQTSSEHFEYRPHIHLATLYVRSQATQEQKNNLKPIIEKILNRIRYEIFPIAQKVLIKENQTISIISISLVNLTNRSVALTIPLHNVNEA